MTNITITDGSGTSITLDGATSTGQAEVSENNCRKEAILTPMPLYLKDSNETDVFDYGGVVKTITLSGKYTDTTRTAIKAWVDSIEALIQGHQDNLSGYPLTFSDTDLRGTLKVKVMDFDTTSTSGSPLLITFTLKIVESSLNS